MIMKKYSIIICTLLVLAGCSDWLSEDGAPKIDYSLYETEAGIELRFDSPPRSPFSG